MYMHIVRKGERVIALKKTTYLNNFFDSSLPIIFLIYINIYHLHMYLYMYVYICPSLSLFLSLSFFIYIYIYIYIQIYIKMWLHMTIALKCIYSKEGAHGFMHLVNSWNLCDILKNVCVWSSINLFKEFKLPSNLKNLFFGLQHPVDNPE